MSDATRPLSGVSILEVNNPAAPLAVRLAASLAGKIAADLGAGVVKLEPAGGDPVRRLPPLLPKGPEGERSALFQFLNTGKTAIVAPSTGRAAAIDLLLQGRVDLLLGEESDAALAAAQARGIPTVAVAGWPAGAADPKAPLSDFTVLALGGLLDMVGDPAREPLRLGGHQGSYAAGLSTFTALMAQLVAKEAGLVPEPARLSLVETMIWVNWKAICGADADGKAPTRQGDRSEFQVVPCSDGWIALVFTVTQYGALCDLIGDPRLRDPKFDSRAGRAKHGAELYGLLKPWFAARDREAIYAEAQGRGVPLGPAYAPADLLTDPQYLARGFIAEMTHPTLGKLKLPQVPVQWSGRSFAPEPVTTATLADLAKARVA